MSALQVETITNKSYVALPLGKGQDDGRMGEFITETGEKCEWMVGLDGHGSNITINCLRTMDWDNIMKEGDALSKVIELLESRGGNRRLTGSTYVEAKMFSNRVETVVVGDSEVFVYVNGELVYNNTPHNIQNPLEAERLKGRMGISRGKISIRYDQNIPYIITDSLLGTRAKEIVIFENGDSLGLSQALGHESVTGFAPEKNIVTFNEGDNVVVIIGSDGLTEMITEEEKKTMHTLTAEELSIIGSERWSQEWEWKGWDKKDKEKSTHTRFEDKDDVLAMKWSRMCGANGCVRI